MGFAQPLLHRGLLNPGHTCAKQQGQGRGGCFAVIVLIGFAKALGSALDQIQSCKHPPYGAIAQGAHGVGDARVDERLRTDDAAGASCTVDHDAGGGTWRK